MSPFHPTVVRGLRFGEHQLSGLLCSSLSRTHLLKVNTHENVQILGSFVCVGFE